MNKIQTDQLLEVMRDSVREIAETMLFVDIVPGDAEKFHFADPIDFVATVSLGQGLRGGLCLAAPEPAALTLATALMGEARQDMDDEMRDGFGELSNMIAGGVQLRVEPILGAISIEPPVITFGSDLETSFDSSFACTSQYFELEGSYFVTELYYLED